MEDSPIFLVIIVLIIVNVATRAVRAQQKGQKLTLRDFLNVGKVDAQTDPRAQILHRFRRRDQIKEGELTPKERVELMKMLDRGEVLRLGDAGEGMVYTLADRSLLSRRLGGSYSPNIGPKILGALGFILLALIIAVAYTLLTAFIWQT